MKTYYEVLSVPSDADADAIKKAFRREIARYHPDKVIHLGAEFQEMAATRAAELTVAYKTLTDAALRADYDANLAAGLPHPPQTARPDSQPQPHDADAFDPPPEHTTPLAGGSGLRFAAERANRDIILRRAITGRVLGIVESLYGELETPPVRGFDLAIVPAAKPRFLGAMPPRVLIRVIESVDAAAITEAHLAASRARVHSGKSPVVVLLFARTIAPQQEISRANDTNARQRKAPDGPDEIAVIAIDTADWSCRLPPNCSKEVHRLANTICER